MGSISLESDGAAESDTPETKEAGAASSAAQRPPIYDGWEIDEDLRHFGRILGGHATAKKKVNKSLGEKPEVAGPMPKFRVDAGHGVPARRASFNSIDKRRARRSSNKVRTAGTVPTRAPGDRVLAVLAWLCLSLGTTGFVCGFALMGWSMHTSRPDLWAIGAPIDAAGQIALVLGLILELDRIWRSNRWSAARLETVGGQLRDLKQANMLSASHGPSSAFYAHWASGAGPEILLGDLKSQLDLLAVRLSRE